MRRLLHTLAVLCLVALTSAQTSFAPSRLDDPEGRAYHHIGFETALEGASCSSAAIGPHALLTATHCELGTDVVTVDGQKYDISAKLRDGQDHTILILPTANFRYVLRVSERDFVTNERVRGWGWPGGRPQAIYREGYFLHTISIEGLPAGEFAYPVFSGDSGGAVIDESGAIITVVSLGDRSAGMVGLVLNFSSDQLAQAYR